MAEQEAALHQTGEDDETGKNGDEGRAEQPDDYASGSGTDTGEEAATGEAGGGGDYPEEQQPGAT
jgi:hypothetical protein